MTADENVSGTVRPIVHCPPEELRSAELRDNVPSRAILLNQLRGAFPQSDLWLVPPMQEMRWNGMAAAAAIGSGIGPWARLPCCGSDLPSCSRTPKFSCATQPT